MKLDVIPNYCRSAAFASSTHVAGVIVAAALCCGTAAQAASSGDLPLPLSGAAYRVAQEGYAAFARHDYGTSAAQAREAIRQRPDVVSLRLLLANSLAAARHYEAATASLSQAIVEIGPDQALVTRRAQIEALSRSASASTHGRSALGKRRAVNASAASAASIAAGAVAGEANEKPLTGAAFDAAQRAYTLYASKDFAGSAKAAGDAIALRPDMLRLRLLQIDAASSAGQDAVAFAVDEDAVKRFGDTDALRSRRSYIGNRLAPKFSSDAFAVLSQGDISQAVELIRRAIAYAPDRTGYRIQLIDALFAANDLPGVEAAASDGIAYGTAHAGDDIMLWTLRGYARAAQGKLELADADFAKDCRKKARRNGTSAWHVRSSPMCGITKASRNARSTCSRRLNSSTTIPIRRSLNAASKRSGC